MKMRSNAQISRLLNPIALNFGTYKYLLNLQLARSCKSFNSNMTNINGSISFSPKTIESVQTVVPSNPTEPRRSRLVTIKENLQANVFCRRFHIVLYHKKVSEEDSGWLLAGWIKESLGKALLEQPLFAGRLRRGDGDDEKFEIVANDSGVRLYEARMAMNLDEFLSLEDRKDGEAQLVHWEDLDELNPQFCPLSYVQVTNFKCRGYSIGFSCSILLADPFTMTSFIKKWANIHKNIVSNPAIPKLPLFYHPNIGNEGCALMNKDGFVHSKSNVGQTSIIKVTSDDINLSQKELAAICINEVGRNLGVVKLPEAFSMYVKERSEEIKVDILSKNASVTKSSSNILSAFSIASWDGSLGADEIILHEANKPTRVSSWINSIAYEGLVMVIPFSDEGISGIKIVVTI